MRLFDKLCSMGDATTRKYFKNTPEDFAVLSIDEIAKHYCSNTQFEWGPEDYPYAKSPWSRCFVEWNEPTEMLTPDGIERRKAGDQTGVFVFSETGQNNIYKLMKECGFSEEEASTASASHDTITAMRFYHYLQQIHRTIDPRYMAFWLQDENGFIKNISQSGHGYREMVKKAGMDGAITAIHSLSHRIALAFTFANCKNVTLEDTTAEQEPPPKIKRRLKIPDIKRYTLNISGKSTSRKQSRGRPNEEGIMPWHLCRGHFATYTEEKKLFGKYTGKFWIPPHMKGKKERGEVIKDYSIQAKETP